LIAHFARSFRHQRGWYKAIIGRRTLGKSILENWGKTGKSDQTESGGISAWRGVLTAGIRYRKLEHLNQTVGNRVNGRATWDQQDDAK
jgi:hypothetical protein